MRVPAVAVAVAMIVGLAVAALASLATTALHGEQRAWRSVQLRYNTLQRERGRPTVAVRIRSLTPAGGGDEQRCVSCHLGMALPDAHPDQPPLTPHPASGCSLSVTVIGCVACHRGHPLALSVASAHGPTDDASSVLDWRRPRPGAGARAATKKAPRTGRLQRELRARLQAGCAPCHLTRGGGVLRYDQRAVPVVAAGHRRFVEQGCFSCHRVAGVYAAAERGPRLGAIGATRARQTLRARLREPQKHNPRSPMPPVGLDRAGLDELLMFLVAQVGLQREPASARRAALLARHRPPGLLATVTARVPEAASETDGALWVTAAGCRGCHRLDGAEGGGVPDLRLVGWYARADDLRRAITQPQQAFAGTMMHALPLPPTVRDSLVAFLRKQRAPLPSSPAEVLAEVCGACHGAAGRPADAKVVVLARRPPTLSRANVERATFLTAVTKGRARTAMPPWGRALARRFIEQLYDKLPGRGSP